MQTALTNSFPLTESTDFGRTWLGRVVMILSATIVVAAAAHISVPLWFTPVPLTLQPLAVLAVGLVLGPWAGFAAMVAYLIEGALGAPVFAPTAGPGGLAHIVGLTGGFLIAYPAVAAIAGGVAEFAAKRLPAFVAAAIACTLATVVLFASGAGWLMARTHLSFTQTWVEAVAPFLLGGAVHVVAASGLYSALARRKQA